MYNSVAVEPGVPHLLEQYKFTKNSSCLYIVSIAKWDCGGCNQTLTTGARLINLLQPTEATFTTRHSRTSIGDPYAMCLHGCINSNQLGAQASFWLYNLSPERYFIHTFREDPPIPQSLHLPWSQEGNNSDAECANCLPFYYVHSRPPQTQANSISTDSFFSQSFERTANLDRCSLVVEFWYEEFQDVVPDSNWCSPGWEE